MGDFFVVERYEVFGFLSEFCGRMFILAVFAVEFKVFMVKWWYEFGSGWECFSAVRC